MLETNALKDLAIAVIRQAVKDLLKSGRIGDQAQMFFNSADLESWAGILQIEPDAIRYNAFRLNENRKNNCKERRAGIAV